MASTVFEIVELDNGEFVLRRSNRRSSQDTVAKDTVAKDTLGEDGLAADALDIDSLVEDDLSVVGVKANKPLVSIKFSAEALKFLDGNSSDIAKVMIEAGLLEVEDLINQHVLEEDVSSEEKPRVLH